MIVELTNNAAQTVAVGDTVIFNTKLFSSGSCGCCCSRNGRFARLTKGGPYRISISANITTGTAGATAQLTVNAGGEPLPEMVLRAVSTAAGDNYTVSRSTIYPNCCKEVTHITVTNTGTVPVVIAANPTLIISKEE